MKTLIADDSPANVKLLRAVLDVPKLPQSGPRYGRNADLSVN